MSFVAAILLGLVQGITEFLPISSDGHLALGRLVLGDQALEAGENLFFVLLLHVATLVAVVVHFRRELIGLFDAFRPGPRGVVARKVIALLAVASLPTAAVGLAIKDACERAYDVPLLVGVGFLLTAGVLASTVGLLRRAAHRTDAGDPPHLADPARWYEDLASVRWRDALVIGTAQGLAPWPGLSRSGSTIAAALWMGVNPLTATRFSLLVSLPAIAGAFVLQARDVESVPDGVPAMAAGFVVAAGVGFLAITWLLAVVRRARLGWFALYALVLGLTVIGLSFANRGGVTEGARTAPAVNAERDFHAVG